MDEESRQYLMKLCRKTLGEAHRLYVEAAQVGEKAQELEKLTKNTIHVQQGTAVAAEAGRLRGAAATLRQKLDELDKQLKDNQDL